MKQLSLGVRNIGIALINFEEEKGGFLSRREIVPNVCRFYKGARVDFIRPAFIRLPVLDYVSFLFTSGYEIRSQIKSFNPDVVIGLSSILSNFWGMYFAKKANIPFMYYWLDIIHELSLSRPFIPIGIFLEKVIIKNSDVVVAINKSLKDYLIEFGANPFDVSVIHGVIDFDRFQPSAYNPHKSERYA